MTHTKAPWHICEVTGRGLQLIRDANGYCVAEAVKPTNSGAAYIDHIANSHLIAAAPDMLAALKAVTACLRGFHAADDFGPLDDEAIDAALAVIAKANGEVA